MSLFGSLPSLAGVRTGRKILGRVLLVAIAGVATVVGRPVWHLMRTWWIDSVPELSPAEAGRGDASRWSAATPLEVIPVEADPTAAEAQLAALVRRATDERLTISISGARHSMGGHTMMDGALVVDMAHFDGMRLDADERLLRVGAGARWADVIPYLDRSGFAVGVMQSNNDFTVGGSISVNCHGWQHDSPPIASTVESLRLLGADGRIVRCSRSENRELFRAALGGYGLFGFILEVELRVVPNAFYHAEQFRVSAAEFWNRYVDLTQDGAEVGMAYGRISVAPGRFLEEGIIVVLRRVADARPVRDTLTTTGPGLLPRLVFRGSIGSDYGKNLRWRLETLFGGEAAGAPRSRNEIMNEPASWFGNRDPASVDILHEYFVPVDRFAAFVGEVRGILLRHRPDLLNLTVRHVLRDFDSMLTYAPDEVFALVMLFHQIRTTAAENDMRDLTRDLIDAALAQGGTYYLPYRPHATREQFERAYPQAPMFFALKRTYDPAGIFQNQFYRRYGLDTE